MSCGRTGPRLDMADGGGQARRTRDAGERSATERQPVRWSGDSELLAQELEHLRGLPPPRRPRDPRAASGRRARPSHRGRAPSPRRCRAGSRRRRAPRGGRRPRRRSPATPRAWASRRRAGGRRGSTRRCPRHRAGSADGVLGIEDPLDDDRHGKRRGKSLQVRPVERRVEEVERFARRARVEQPPDGGQRAVVERPVDPPLAVARADHGQVDGEEHGAEAGVDRLRDQVVGDAVIAKDVDLEEPRRGGRCSRDLSGARGCERRQAERRADGCGSPGEALLPIRMRHALVGDRSHDDR